MPEKFGDLSPAEAARKSAEVRRAKAGVKGIDRIKAEAQDLAHELVRAAKGEGPWANLQIKDRYQALKLVLEYGLGKPRPLERGEDVNGEDEEPEDDSLPLN